MRDYIHEQTMEYTNVMEPKYVCPNCNFVLDAHDTVYVSTHEIDCDDVVGCVYCAEWKRVDAVNYVSECICGQDVYAEKYLQQKDLPHMQIGCDECVIEFDAYEKLDVLD